MGSFSIYLWIGVAELKEYPVINKILVISMITYNIIFISGLISSYLNNPIFLNTSFSFSFWIILILGFILFGRKYIVVWRFMSPQYLTLFLYILGWLAVVFVNQYLPIDFLDYIYIVLIFVNILIYFSSGVILDKLLGIKRIKDKKVRKIVNTVKEDIGIKGRVKVGFGEYPILNAMAYGSFFDKRIAIIAENIDNIPEDELKGIIAHELAHTKGNHTLILAVITITDLIIRMIFGFPATYYDYTFGNPQIPFVLFLVINFSVYILLYFFVRILEGYADKKAKKAGYKDQLVKALYNLESFYASGREIGLNTMLLCEEKISRDNKMLDYVETAQYINNSMIKPSKLSLLGNLLNSHPPTYHRILSILSDEISPYKETFLPLFYLRSKNQKKYAKEYSEARKGFKHIANQKFKELFNIENISLFFNNLEIKEKYKFFIDKNYIFKNLITGKYKYGKIEGLKLEDDISENVYFRINNQKNHKNEFLNASIYTKYEVNIGNHYIFSKTNPLKLNQIEFNEDKSNGYYYFLDRNQKEIKKVINRTKIPISLEKIQDFLHNHVFLKTKGKLKITQCINFENKENLGDSLIELKNFHFNDNEDQTLIAKLKDLIIKPKNIRFGIKKNEENRIYYDQILNWLLNNNIRTYFYLKKPVNNIEIGYIQEITHNSGKEGEISKNTKSSIKNHSYIQIKTIFGNKKKIKLNKIEFISFEYNTGTVQLKSETSLFSKIGYYILKKVKPQKIFI